MKLLLVGNHLSALGQNQNVWQDLASHLSLAGYEVITTSAVEYKILRLLDMLVTIYLRRRDYDAAQVDVFSGLAFSWAELCGRALHAFGKPFVLTLHGGNLPEFGQKNPTRVKKLLGLASQVIAPSRYLQEQMALYRQDIQLIPNPLEIANYPFRLRSIPKPFLVWLRAFHEIYNPSLAPRVLAGLLEEFPVAHLLMVGPDKGDGSLQETIRVAEELGVRHLIDIPGAIPKARVPEFLNQGDIFLNTTNIDNTPVSVMEAMACGLCVVSTDVGGIPWLIEDGQDGLLVPPDNLDAMVVTVKRILHDSLLAQSLSATARKKTEQLDWSSIIPLWKDLFDSIV